MRIRKVYQGNLADNKIVNTDSNSQTDTYSCDYINGALDEINDKTIPENFQNLVTFESGEEVANGQFSKIGNIIIVRYQGQSKTHSANTLLFTIPSGYRPSAQVNIPFVKNTVAYGIMQIAANGQCKITQISSTTDTGRVYFQAIYTI